jgi:predicted TPR repeat methyltransferase
MTTSRDRGAGDGPFAPQEPGTRTEVAELYERVAPQFDEIAAASGYAGPAWLAEQLPRLPDMARAADFGCATGALGKILRERYPAAHLTGVDFAQQMLERARDLGVYDAIVRHDLNGPLPWIGPRSLDLVVALGFSEFLDHPADLVAEAARILVPGGVLLISFQQHRPDAPERAPRVTSGGGIRHHAYTLGEVRTMLEEAGLTVDLIEAMTGYVSRSGFVHPYLMVVASRLA